LLDGGDLGLIVRRDDTVPEEDFTVLAVLPSPPDRPALVS